MSQSEVEGAGARARRDGCGRDVRRAGRKVRTSFVGGVASARAVLLADLAREGIDELFVTPPVCERCAWRSTTTKSTDMS